jgi:hypothetical protein
MRNCTAGGGLVPGAKAALPSHQVSPTAGVSSPRLGKKELGQQSVARLEDSSSASPRQLTVAVRLSCDFLDSASAPQLQSQLVSMSTDPNLSHPIHFRQSRSLCISMVSDAGVWMVENAGSQSEKHFHRCDQHSQSRHAQQQSPRNSKKRIVSENSWIFKEEVD